MAVDPEDRSGEADAVAAQVAKGERAAEKRREQADAEQQRTPGAEAPPPERRRRGNADVAHSHARLIEYSNDYLGVPRHVMAGALHEAPQEYVTVDKARELVDAFLNREVQG